MQGSSKMFGEEGLRERAPRTVSLLQLPQSEEMTPGEKALIVVLMCFAATAEGMDGALFPSVTTALVELEKFDVGNLAFLSSAQSLVQAFSGPMWGILGSRAVIRRRDILFIGCFAQGLATIVMCFFITNLPIMMVLRALNGFALAALRPVANSIIADTFDDTSRGTMFGTINMSMMLGSGFAGWQATKNSRTDFGIMYGWKLAFIIVGSFTALLGPVIFLLLKEPLVKPDKSEGGIMLELYTLIKLMKKYTFAACVIQGCFGLVPWKAFEFRTFFFQQSGVDDDTAGQINSYGMFAAAAGSILGGFIGDMLARIFGCHGRVLCAELSIFGGIPIAYFTFMVRPSADTAYLYFTALVIALGLVATWTPAGANSPILCSIASEAERTLVLAWQVSLEGAVGALGPVMFTVLLQNVFGFNPKCITEPESVVGSCDNSSAAGNALFWTSCVPWVFCGLIYSTMHLSYPRDIKAQEMEKLYCRQPWARRPWSGVA